MHDRLQGTSERTENSLFDVFSMVPLKYQYFETPFISQINVNTCINVK